MVTTAGEGRTCALVLRTGRKNKDANLTVWPQGFTTSLGFAIAQLVHV